MPEKEIEALAERTGHNTFKVFAEWMKENREAWERHLAQQDRKLEEIHTEVRRTNGRVTTLEKQTELVEALSVNKKEWEAERSEHEREAAKDRATLEVRHSDRFWKVAQTGATLFGGGLIGYFGHLAGWW